MNWIVGGNASARQEFVRYNNIADPLYVNAVCDVRGRKLRNGDRIYWLWPPPDMETENALTLLAAFAGQPLASFDAYKADK